MQRNNFMFWLRTLNCSVLPHLVLLVFLSQGDVGVSGTKGVQGSPGPKVCIIVTSTDYSSYHFAYIFADMHNLIRFVHMKKFTGDIITIQIYYEFVSISLEHRGTKD